MVQGTTENFLISKSFLLQNSLIRSCAPVSVAFKSVDHMLLPFNIAHALIVFFILTCLYQGRGWRELVDARTFAACCGRPNCFLLLLNGQTCRVRCRECAMRPVLLEG